jgi:hypothetical protein
MTAPWTGTCTGTADWTATDARYHGGTWTHCADGDWAGGPRTSWKSCYTTATTTDVVTSSGTAVTSVEYATLAGDSTTVIAALATESSDATGTPPVSLGALIVALVLLVSLMA